MAKKKKFNRRILVLLPIVVVVIGAIGAGIVIYRSPGDPQKTFAKAQAAFDRGEYYEARSLANRAINDSKDTPANVDYTYKAALLNLRVASEGKPPITQHEREEASMAGMQLLKTVVRLDPKHVDAQKQICDRYWAAVLNPRSDIHGKWEMFIPEVDTYLGMKPDDDEMLYRRAVANAALYRALAGGDSDKAALKDFDSLLALKPANLEYWRGKASFLWEKKDHEAALAVMLEGTQKNPHSAAFCVAYADFLRMDEALKEIKLKKGEKLASQLQYEEAIRRQPDNVDGYLALAGVQAGDQHYKEAIALLETAAQKDPCDYRAYEQAAIAYERSADRHNAVKILKLGLSTINDALSKWSGPAKPAAGATSAPSASPLASTDKNLMEEGQFRLTYRLATSLATLASLPDQSENRQALLKEASDLGADLNKYRTNCYEYSKVMGLVALVNKEYEKAVTLLEEATTRIDEKYGGRSFDVQTASWLANGYLALGRKGDAQKVLEKIRKVDQKDTAPLMDLISLSISTGDFGRAKEFVATVLAVEPKNEQALSLSRALDIADANVLPSKLPADMKFGDLVVQVLVQKARTLESEQQHHEAIVLLGQMWDRDPGNTAIFAELLNRLLAAHETAQAKAAIKEAKVRFANMPETMDALQKSEDVLLAPSEADRYKLRLASADKEKDAFAKAVAKSSVEADYSNALPASDNEKYVHADASLKYLKEALAIQPDSREVLGRLLQRYMIAGKWDEGQAVVEKLAGLNTDGVGGKLVRGEFLLNKGVSTQNKPDIEAAAGLFKEGLKEKSSFANAWASLGAAYGALRQYTEAEDAYDHVLKIDPGHINGTIGMARTKLALLKMGEYEELIKHAYRLVPGNEWVKNRYLDIIAPAAGPDQLAKLIKLCEQNRQTNPGDIENTMRLARLYEKAKQTANAEKLYVEQYNSSTNKLAAGAQLVDFYVRNKKQSDADACVRELLKDPNVDKAGAYLLWGQELASTPEGTDQAEAAFKKAIELKPDDPRMQLTLATFYARQPDHMKQAAEVLAKYIAAQKDSTSRPEIRRQLARYTIDAGQYDQANKMVSEMIAADAGDFEARELNGLILLHQNKPAEAIEQFNQALSINASHADSLKWRGIAQLQKGDKRKALEDLGRAADISKDSNIEMLVVEISNSLKDYDNSEKILRAILESRPDDMAAVGRLADVYIAQGDQGWGRLEKLIADGKKSYPKEPTYYQIEARMWDIRKQSTRELDALKPLLAMPEPAVVGTALERSLRVLQFTNQYDKMADLVGQYVQKDGFGWVKVYQGYAAFKRNKTAEADKCFAEAVLGASHNQIVLVLSEIEMAYGAAQAADKSSQWLKQRGDNDPLAWQQLAIEYARAQNVPLAQDACQIALKNASGMEKARVCQDAGGMYYDLANSQTGPKRAEMLALSEKAYLESLGLAPENKDALNNLAYLYVEDLDQPAKALPYAEKAYNLSPGAADVADTYAWVLARLKRYDEARGILEHTIETQEGRPPFRYHLGWIYEQTGQYDKAKRQYQDALNAITNDKDPLGDLLKQAIERVKKVAP